jgi:ubiquinone/menaquinone biosynthesis C-methylase UbiE
VEKAVTPTEHLAENGIEAIDRVRRRIGSDLEGIRKRLNRPATILHRFLAGANFLLAVMRGPMRSQILDPAVVKTANSEFERLFPPTLPEMTTFALEDPDEYEERVRQYEKTCGSPRIPFETEADFYRLIVRDPLRKSEEYFLFQAAVEHDQLNNGSFSAVDLGTGSGRLAFCLAEFLLELRISYVIYGLDISSENIRDALSIKASKGHERIKFVQADMTRTSFASSRFSLCNCSSSAYMVPFYKRPFQLLEMVRILGRGGTGVMTGPNEYFSAWQYTLRMGTSNLSTYLNPFNLMVAHRLGPIGLLIDKTAKKRRDFSYPVTQEVCEALRLMGCEATRVEYWPESGGVGLFSAITFRTSKETKKRINGYRRFMEKVNKKTGVAPI